MKKLVFITCNNSYVLKSIVALKQFLLKNEDYDMAIIGTTFSNEMKELCYKHNILIKEIDLSSDFINIDKRPAGHQYPIECFYHFYVYKLFDYDYVIQIEPDIYTNKKINIDLSKIKYVGGSYSPHLFISNFYTIMDNYDKIQKSISKRGDIHQNRIHGGVKIYNVNGLKEINFYDKIVEYYKLCWKLNCPRCGDDSLMVLYQLFHKEHITLLKPEFHLIFHNKINISPDDIIFFHSTACNPKYWNIKDPDKESSVVRFFYDKCIGFIEKNFDSDFKKKLF